MRSIDLNCDLGESCGNDTDLMQLISSANIACGYHAGDAETMKRTVDLALEYGVAIGAHPGYRDRENFGRTSMNLPPEEIRSIVTDQILALAEIAASAGTHISHVKPHGALYNQSARDAKLAAVIAEAVLEINPRLILFGLSMSHSITEAQKIGLQTAAEVFADRTYQADGSLTPRTAADALIHNKSIAAEQVLDMVKYGHVRSTEGLIIPIIADTICIHGDGKRAVEFASTIRRRLIESDVRLESRRLESRL